MAMLPPYHEKHQHDSLQITPPPQQFYSPTWSLRRLTFDPRAKLTMDTPSSLTAPPQPRGNSNLYTTFSDETPSECQWNTSTWTWSSDFSCHRTSLQGFQRGVVLYDWAILRPVRSPPTPPEPLYKLPKRVIQSVLRTVPRASLIVRYGSRTRYVRTEHVTVTVNFSRKTENEFFRANDIHTDLQACIKKVFTDAGYASPKRCSFRYTHRDSKPFLIAYSNSGTPKPQFTGWLQMPFIIFREPTQFRFIVALKWLSGHRTDSTYGSRTDRARRISDLRNETSLYDRNLISISRGAGQFCALGSRKGLDKWKSET
ncbi:uncharacterized protein BDR25DRAFT_360752 [Lindgomyces ingoldianus]|uniref:Uncharacterized protein n=1 Tax=Lindgomyces ingoldianus TaxID=673940 RepID=A0ACB6QE52_9PLEO|nr:uncharacterized protein BDR25DRAFT_360752 [Lindgomyces ingoldianus]KAF2465135.1 hypothetical protein BDR25DRAFT_360752 [Lindgomyces ingoldianus]